MAERPARIAVLGMSVSAVCGVRDHARVLARALDGAGYECSEHWLAREEGSLRDGWGEVGSWMRGLTRELGASRPDAVLLHYSVFAFSHRGFPFYVGPTVSAIRRSGVPLVALMHEFAYPWGLGGPRGEAWALSHRALLIDVVRASRALAVTTDFRLDWLSSRRWLPHRPLGLAPVFSSLPRAVRRARADGRPPLLGLFGYSYDDPSTALVLDALSLLAERGVELRLVLLGAPGRASGLGERWHAAAAARGIAELVSFLGPLEEQELSDALASCDLLLFADAAGPSSRKSTLAASLASGVPVIAADGPRRWSELDEHRAGLIVDRSASALAGAIAKLISEPAEAEALGERGRIFAEQRMGVERSSGVISGLLDQALAAGAPA